MTFYCNLYKAFQLKLFIPKFPLDEALLPLKQRCTQEKLPSPPKNCHQKNWYDIWLTFSWSWNISSLLVFLIFTSFRGIPRTILTSVMDLFATSSLKESWIFTKSSHRSVLKQDILKTMERLTRKHTCKNLTFGNSV